MVNLTQLWLNLFMVLMLLARTVAISMLLYPICCRFILQCPGLISPTLLLWFLLNLPMV